MDNSIKNIWNNIVKELEDDIKINNLDIWFDSIKDIYLKEDGTVIIEVPNSLYIENISKKEKEIADRLKVYLNRNDIKITYHIKEEKKQDIHPLSLQKPVIEIIGKDDFTNTINPEFTFEEMIVHSFNQFAVSIAKNISEQIGKFNPFFVHSKPGLGKTHLLHAIGNEIMKNRPNSRVLYLTAEDFVNEFIEAIEKKKVDSFRQKYRSLDCLLIDDIQFIIKKERSEEEFFFTFNSLFDDKKQIVVTSDRPPNDIELNERLISRFKSGPIADIRPPEYEARVAILKRENDRKNYNLSDEIIKFIAENVQDSIRSLKGCIALVYHRSQYLEKYPSIEDVKEWIADYLPKDISGKDAPSVERIQEIVAEEYGITVDDLKSRQRHERFAFPRQIAIYIACAISGMSLPEIGKAFNKDHSTVIHARDKIAQLIQNDPFFNEKINNLINRIGRKS